MLCGVLSLAAMRQAAAPGSFAERVVLESVDDAGADERIVIWIERKPGAVWAVGPRRQPAAPRRATSRARDDYVFEGYELDDALEAANGALEDDVSVLEQDGGAGRVAPFTRKELLARSSAGSSAGEA